MYYRNNSDTVNKHVLLILLITFLYQFNPRKPLSLRSPDLVSKPGPGDEMHCVAVVVDSSVVLDDDNEAKKDLVAFMDMLHAKGRSDVCL